jgi:hypothetical protein
MNKITEYMKKYLLKLDVDTHTKAILIKNKLIKAGNKRATINDAIIVAIEYYAKTIQ